MESVKIVNGNEGKHYDFVLIGAGLHNAVFARLAMDNGYTCLVVEKRDHLGGNVADFKIGDINVHKYGAHIFHTSDDKVWEFMNKYTKFNSYVNSPIAKFGEEVYNLPFNMNTFNKMWKDVDTPEEAKKRIEEQRYCAGIGVPTNLEEQAISLVGVDIYEKLIKGYTQKQWGTECKNLPVDIIKRLPLRFTYDNNYFNDKYQGIPVEGYSKLIMKLFDGCDVMLNTKYTSENRDMFNEMGDTIVYSGCIDEYYDYCFGHLDYRSLRFEHKVLPIQNYQGNAVVNYTDNITSFTRIIEHKHFDVWNKKVQDENMTVITTEYPQEYRSGIDEPYYPINDSKNMSMYSEYKALVDLESKVIFGGRLAEYTYYDMDKVVKSAMVNFEPFIPEKI